MPDESPSGRMRDERKLTDDLLRELYVDHRLTMRTLAKRFGVTYQRIHQRLSTMGIKGNVHRRELDPELLRKMYVDLRMTQSTMAAEFSASVDKIRRELRRHDIRRPKSLEHYASRHPREEIVQLYITDGLFQANAARRLGIPVKIFSKLLERYGITDRHFGGPANYEIDSEHLRRLYTTDGRTITAIAALYGCSQDVIHDRLKSLGIPIERARRNAARS